MSQTSTCELWEEQRLNIQDKERRLRLSLETRVTEDVTVICCKGRIAYGIEAAALFGEIAELAPETRRVVIDLSGVEMIDAAGLGALISVALTAQASQFWVKLAAPGNLIRQLLELTKLTSVFEVHPTLDAASRPVDKRHDGPPRVTTLVSALKPDTSLEGQIQPDRFALG